MECLGQLEKFLHDDPSPTPTLIKAALTHVQFETIHPFLDGNGRLGRLLITLILCAGGALTEPLLYLSLYLKTNRSEYYDLLQRMRDTGDWEEWLRFFLQGVLETAETGVQTTRAILALFAEDRMQVKQLKRGTISARRVLEQAQRMPLLTIARASEAIQLSIPTVTAAIGALQEAGILHEQTGRQRDRVYVYSRYLALLNAGTEPLRP